jgi:oligopeptide transport system permease protein
MLLFPAGLLSLTLYCFNFIGDGLRDALRSQGTLTPP